MSFHNPYHFVPVANGSDFDCDLSKEDFKLGNVGSVTMIGIAVTPIQAVLSVGWLRNPRLS